MYTSSSNHSPEFRKFLLCRKLWEWKERAEKTLADVVFFFFFFHPPQNRTIHDADNVESSHLIKVVHAVQSLKRKKMHLCHAVKVGKLSNTN